uniref:Uncharacterized protein n=1 Tax=Triticum urartu TaxID=4572 RepID=A0A8R7URC6_TRIUA
MDLHRNLSRESETRRAMSERDRPRPVSPATTGARVFSTLAQRNSGSLATRAATSAPERPRPARKASTASGLEGDLRWESLAEALRACARVRPQVETRYPSTSKLGFGKMAGAAVDMRRRSWEAGDAEGDERSWVRRQHLSRSMAAPRRRRLAAAAAAREWEKRDGRWW